MERGKDMANLKLNQVIAIEKGAKATGEASLTAAYHAAQKLGPWNGVTRVYQPKDEDGDTLPPESTRVQFKGQDLLNSVRLNLGRLMDVTATKDEGNTQARADVIVDGELILSQLPVPTLLYLEKKLGDLQNSLLRSLPVLDPADDWNLDENQGVYKSEPVQTVRTKKVPRAFEKAKATDKHPAQVEVFTEDIPVGTWTTTKLSGAFTETRKAELLEKVRRLIQAVKEARELANVTEVRDVRIGEAVFDYLGW
jgi:hypothetical protein